jgi:hypothetical protein
MTFREPDSLVELSVTLLNVTSSGPDGKFVTVMVMVVPVTVALRIRGILWALAKGANAKNSAKISELGNRTRLSLRNKSVRAGDAIGDCWLFVFMFRPFSFSLRFLGTGASFASVTRTFEERIGTLLESGDQIENCGG